MEARQQKNNASSAKDSFAVSPPSISLPKGGGAIRGIGEKFAANPVTGTGSMTVPIPTSPGRSGFGPQLSLSYDSGAGNGAFGLGWNLSLPSITRKTDKGLPKYQDTDESDVFILSGAEDLVPVGNATNDPSNKFSVRRYRPRIEGLFARIEKWTALDGSNAFWRSISKENITTWYGKKEESRIADPADPTHIFSWLICESYDDKGNAIRYQYKAENVDGIDLSAANERNRSRTAQRYLKCIKYGNKTPRASNEDLTLRTDWMFEVVFDYGEHYAENAQDQPTVVDITGTQRQWAVREDPFSSYRAGFEVRTYRLCQRVLMFHHFPGDLEIGDYLVRATHFTISPDPAASFITGVTQSGYLWQAATQTYLKKSFPPVEFKYSKATIDETVREVEEDSLENLPYGLDGSHYQWVDLDGEGLSGILTEQSGAWFYKRNLGAIPVSKPDEKLQYAARFAPIERLPTMPSPANLSGGQQLLDLAGDGQLDVVEFDGAVPGFFERTPDEAWETFTAFKSLPNIAWKDQNLKFVDLTGDGHADILVTEDEVFTWYPSLAEEGFGPAEKVRQTFDEEAGPRLVFADGTQSIYLSDLSGDGLTDLVRIRNGEVCYWPNLGYGRFGKKVTMDNAPWFDAPDQFDQKRIRLADIDGSGTVDILYLGRDGVHLYFNQAGNRWSPVRKLNTFPRADSLSSVMAADLFGNGTACLVWSSPLPGDARRPMRYIDLMGGQKPHLLIETTNNLGAKTKVDYAPSTKFYLLDKFAGRPWITKLPFPVHCVEKVTVTDKWRNTSFATTYSYHHGYFDGIEREFRGFGRVEQVDVEDYGKFSKGNVASPYITDNHELHQPPVKTITWYHTGAAFERDRILSAFRQEYFTVPGFIEHQLPEPTLAPDDLSPEEWREAVRACKGMVLRQEVFELDVDALARGEALPVRLFTTAYHNNNIKRLQPRGHNRHAVFLVTESEAITYHYELDLRPPVASPDPRIAHTLNLRIDDYGNILESAAAVYPRIGINTDTSLTGEQRALINQVQKNESHLALNCTRFTDADIDGPNTYRLGMPCQTQAWEVTGIQPAGRYFTLAELKNKNLTTSSVGEISYHQQPNGTPQKRLVECARTLYFADNLIDHRPFGQHGPLGLPFESYKLALTRDLITSVYVDAERINAALSALDHQVNDYPASGYYKGNALFAAHPITPETPENQYWVASGRAGFESDAAQHFYLPERYTDPFGNLTTLKYDGKYDLFIQSSTDAMGNTSGIAMERNTPTVSDPRTERPRFDYRVLAPIEMVDASGNHSEAVFDVRGLVVAAAVKGKKVNGSWEGDHLDGWTFDQINPSETAVAGFCLKRDFDTAQTQQARTWLGTATTRFVYHFGESWSAANKPNWTQRMAGASAFAREIHAGQPGGAASPLQVTLECSDGGGNVLMKKVQAEADPKLPIADQKLRWIINGLTVLNNKGKPVKQYEPAFSADFGCELPQANGVTPIMYYDAAGRVVRTEMPDGTFSKVEFSPWHVRAFDQNDTAFDPKPINPNHSDWYKRRTDPAHPLFAEFNTPENSRAADLVKAHADTPSETHLDSLGREVIAIAHNRTHGVDEKYLTFTKLDAEGKPLWIRDARGNLVMQYITPAKANNDPGNAMPATAVPCYDIAGNLLYQHSMDAGDRWMLMDAAGKPMLAWDMNETPQGTAATREDRFYSTDYDKLHRPTAQWLTKNTASPIMVERYEYRDTQNPDGTLNRQLAQDAAANMIGQLVRHYDPSGLVETICRDFKGNVQEIRRTLNSVPEESVVDWQTNPASQLESETYEQITEHDALNRMARLYNWHLGVGSRVAVYEPQYNKRGLLLSEQLIVKATRNNATSGKRFDEVPGVTQTNNAIAAIRYNAKGQKEYLELGNGTITRYDYDKKTFRLIQLRTTRPSQDPPFPGTHSNLLNPNILQQLNYTYDPVGNITEIADEAYKPVYFANGIAEPRNLYEYDALYRLTWTQGRETAQGGDAVRDGDEPAIANGFPITDQTLRRYTQSYEYDSVGNFVTMRHGVPSDTAKGWTRAYDCATDSNRLLSTEQAGNVTSYGYDTHGNMLNLANVAPSQHLQWDHRDMIKRINLGGGGTAYYQYDSGKQRTRKRIENQNGLGGYWERIYLGGYERYRRYNGNGSTLVEEIESHHLFEGEQRVLLVNDVIKTDRKHANNIAFKEEPIYRYQYSSHLGSACLELDDAANIISYEEYHPYGTSAYRLMKSRIEAPGKRYRYTGMERDEESGLGYHTARYYLPWLGRWGSTDSVGVVAGLNLFRYSNNDPINRSDTNGNQSSKANPSDSEILQWWTKERETELLDVMLSDYESSLRMQDKINQEHFRDEPIHWFGRVDPWCRGGDDPSGRWYEGEERLKAFKEELKWMGRTFEDIPKRIRSYYTEYKIRMRGTDNIAMLVVGGYLETVTTTTGYFRAAGSKANAQFKISMLDSLEEANLARQLGIDHGTLRKTAHLLRVRVYGDNWNLKTEWFELSEPSGIGRFKKVDGKYLRLTDTEQKAYARGVIEKGDVVVMEGRLPPCTGPGGCHSILTDKAISNENYIIYWYDAPPSKVNATGTDARLYTPQDGFVPK